MKVGVHETAPVDETATRFPLAQVTREFEGGVLQPQSLVNRVEKRCADAWAAGHTVAWSFKPDAARVADGTWRPYIEDLARHLHARGVTDRTIVIIWHEAEASFTDPAKYVEMFNTVHDWLIAVCPAIVTCHAALGYYYRDITLEQARAWRTKATLNAIDLYSGRSFPLSMTLQTSTGFGTWRLSRPAGARWGVTERGWIADVTQSRERVDAINAEAAYLMSLDDDARPELYIVWNTKGAESDSKLVLDGPAIEALGDLFDDLTLIECPMCHGTGHINPHDPALTHI